MHTDDDRSCASRHWLDWLWRWSRLGLSLYALLIIHWILSRILFRVFLRVFLL